MDEKERITLGTGESMTLELQPGVQSKIKNSNPMNWDIEIETAAGSLIMFTVPAGGTFSITPSEEFRRFAINCGPLRPFGPRPIDED